MKKFNLEQAKAGKSVCTRSGKPVRIICFDRENANNFPANDYPIIALVKDGPNNGELVLSFNNEGHYNHCDSSDMDLMMASEKHVGWVNIYRDGFGEKTGGIIYESKSEAEQGKYDVTGITAKIEWED